MHVPESSQAGWVEPMKTERTITISMAQMRSCGVKILNTLAKVRDGVWERQELDLSFLN